MGKRKNIAATELPQEALRVDRRGRRSNKRMTDSLKDQQPNYGGEGRWENLGWSHKS